MGVNSYPPLAVSDQAAFLLAYDLCYSSTLIAFKVKPLQEITFYTATRAIF